MSGSKLGGRKVDFVIKPNIRKYMNRINITLDSATQAILDAQAAKEGRSRSQHIRELVKAEQKRLKRNKDR